MANVTTYLQQGVQPAVGADKDYVMETELTLALGATDDVYYALTIPSGHLVRNVVCEVVQAAGETATASVGMSSDKIGTEINDDGFDASVNLNATAGTLTIGAGGTDTYVTAGGYLNLTPAATYIGLELTVSATPLGTAGKLKVRALCTDCTSVLP